MTDWYVVVFRKTGNAGDIAWDSYVTNQDTVPFLVSPASVQPSVGALIVPLPNAAARCLLSHFSRTNANPRNTFRRLPFPLSSISAPTVSTYV